MHGRAWFVSSVQLAVISEPCGHVIITLLHLLQNELRQHEEGVKSGRQPDIIPGPYVGVSKALLHDSCHIPSRGSARMLYSEHCWNEACVVQGS